MMKMIEESLDGEKRCKSLSRDVKKIQSSIRELKDHWPKGTVGRKIVKHYADYLVCEINEYGKDMISVNGLVAFIDLIENHLHEWSYCENYEPGSGPYPQLEIYVDPKIKISPDESLIQVKKMLEHLDVPLDRWLVYFNVPEPDDHWDFDASITVKNILK
jgi:hypothetical protein